MEAETFDIVLTDLRMAGKSGLKVIDRAITQQNRPICIMMTAYGNVETAVEAMRRGAFDFDQAVSLEKLEILIKRALQSRRIEAENVVYTSGSTRSIVSMVSLVTHLASTTCRTRSNSLRLPRPLHYSKERLARVKSSSLKPSIKTATALASLRPRALCGFGSQSP